MCNKLNIIVFLVFATVVAGCARQTVSESVAEVTLWSDCWNGEKFQSITLERGETISFDFMSEIEAGSLSMCLYNEEGDVVIELGVGIEDVFRYEVESSGDYRLKVTGNDFDGTMEVSWTVQG